MIAYYFGIEYPAKGRATCHVLLQRDDREFEPLKVWAHDGTAYEAHRRRAARLMLEHRTGARVDSELAAAFVARPGRDLMRVEPAEIDSFAYQPSLLPP